MVLPLPFGSEKARKRRRTVGGGGREEDEMREVAATGVDGMQEGIGQ